MEPFAVQGNEHMMASRMVSVVNPDVSRGVGQSRLYMRYISDIPADILYTIAQYVDSLRELVLVCKRWRNIILFAPSLWTNIHIKFPAASKVSPCPGDLRPVRMARAALRRAGPTTKLSLHLEMHDISHNISFATAVVHMISSRGYQSIRELTLDGNWFPLAANIPPESISDLFSFLVGEWNSLLHLHLGVFPPTFDKVLPPFLDSIISTAPALQHIGISTDLLPLVEKKLSTKRSLISLEVTRPVFSKEPLRFNVWPHIKSFKISTPSGHHYRTGSRLDLRAINPPSSAKGEISAFPLLTHASFVNHTLEFCSSLRLKLLTDLVLNRVKVNAPALHSVEMPLLRNLVAQKTREINCIVAPMLETLTIGPLPEPVNVGYYLSKWFSGDPLQLDPVHLDLRPIYSGSSFIDTTVPLASVYLLRRVERISISRLSVVRQPDRWKYRMLESVTDDDREATKHMVMLPKWKKMDLDGDGVPDWLWDIIIARKMAGSPIQLNFAD